MRLLHARIQRVLTRLQLLTEAPAGKALDGDAYITRSGTGHKPPPGVNLDALAEDDDEPTRPDQPPPRDRSLYDHYRWRFGRSKGDVERLEILAMLAERDYWEYTRRTDTGRHRRPAKEIRTERDRRIIREYGGIPALEVAVFERIDTRSVKRVRKEYGVREVDGLKASAAA